MFGRIKKWWDNLAEVEVVEDVKENRYAEGESILEEKYPLLGKIEWERHSRKREFIALNLQGDDDSITEPYLSLAEDMLKGNWEASFFTSKAVNPYTKGEYTHYDYNQIILSSERLGLWVAAPEAGVGYTYYPYQKKRYTKFAAPATTHNLLNPTSEELGMITWVVQVIATGIRVAAREKQEAEAKLKRDTWASGIMALLGEEVI